jgi:hypothetical protein
MIAEFTYSTFWNLDGIKHVLPENTISWNCQPWQKTSSRINPHKKYDVRLAIEPNEKVLKSTYQTLRKKSIQDVEMFMEAALAPQFGATERIATYIEGVSEIKERKITDVEVAERELKLKEVVAEIEAHKKSQNYINTVEVQFDPGFANTQGENLLGTQTSPAIHGGDLLAPQDLLEIAVNLTIGEIYQQCRCAIEGKLVKGQHLPAKYPSSPTSIHARVTEISKPYSAVFHGLPVRVNQRCTVWRNDQSIGVAIDFYFDAIYRRALIVNINQTTLQE